MTQDEEKYTNIFTIEERKKIIAQTIGELRRSKNLSQKEVAAQIEVSQATYSAYERGRNEPPAEIIVRLSYLFDCPVDMIVQRDRQYRNAEELQSQLAVIGKELEEYQRQINEGGTDATDASGMINALGKLVTALTGYSQTEAAQKALDIRESD